MIGKWDIPNEQLKKQCIDAVLARLDEQDGTAFGRLAAEELIDIIAEYVGPAAYRRAIDDAKRSLQAKVADLEVDLDILKPRS